MIRAPHGAGLTLAIVAALAPAVVHADGVRSEAAVTRVSLLRSGGRTSVVIDLYDAARRATTVASTGDGFSVEIGPVRQVVVAQNFKAAQSSPLVREVTIRGVPQSDNATLVRVDVKALTPVSGRVRSVGRRVYLDIAPVQVSGPDKVNADAGQPRLQSVPNPPSEGGGESDMLRRARQLAEHPDVRGLVRLREELLQRPGSSESDARSESGRADRAPMLLDRYLDQARQRQLEIDARLLRQAQLAEYHVAMQQFIPELDRISRIVTAWNAGSERPGNLPALVGAILPRLRQLPPPAELAAVHASVCSALDAVAKAAAAPAGPESAGRVSGGDLARATARLREALKEFAPGRL